MTTQSSKETWWGRGKKNSPCKQGRGVNIDPHVPIKPTRLAGNLTRFPFLFVFTRFVSLRFSYVNFRLGRVSLIVFAFNAATLERESTRTIDSNHGIP